MSFKFNLEKVFSNSFWWAGVIGLLLLSQTRIELLLSLFKATWISSLFHPSLLEKDVITIANIITPVRGIVFLLSLAALVYPIFQDIRKSEIILNSQIKSYHILQAILLFLVLCIFFSPGEINGLALEYANSSLVMFTRASSVSYSQRFLLPAIANILFFRGDFFFLVFSFICTLLFVFILRIWFIANQIQVSVWQLVSLGTMSFVYFQIQTPGYPDILINIFILLAFTFKLDIKAKLSLYVLSLATHEASLFIWAALAFLLFDFKEATQFLVVSAMYFFLFLSTNDGLLGALSTRQVGETSNLMWLVSYPARELLGIFFGLKGLWGIIIGATSYLLIQKNYKEVFQLLAILSAGILMTFMGVDTSRLFGWTFMAVLISWRILVHAQGKWVKVLNVVLAINILIPSVNVFLIMNPFIASGIYQTIFNSFLSF